MLELRTGFLQVVVVVVLCLVSLCAPSAAMNVTSGFRSTSNSTVKRQKRNVLCEDLPAKLLTEILGPAYNSRYMSVNEPPPPEDHEETAVGNHKRKAGIVPSFYVEEGYSQPLSDEPAWNLNDHQMYSSFSEGTTRKKRSVRQVRQWECLSVIRWIDLGSDYFPRYIRSVECTSSNCWYGHFKCKAKSFTVKILRRRRGRCVRAAPGTKVGNKGLPHELKQVWVWEERAVNFCCECAAED